MATGGIADPYGVSPALCFQDLVSADLKEMPAQLAKRSFVFDQQNRFIAFQIRRDFRGSAFDIFRRRRLGKVDVEASSCARFADDFDVSAALFHNPVDHRQTEASSLALLFRSEKGFEDPRLCGSIH